MDETVQFDTVGHKIGAFVPGTHVRMPGRQGGALSGLKFAAKDLFDIAGHVTGCGNPTWAATHGPAPVTAPAVQRLLDAGADLVGKAITDELAWSLMGENAHYGTPLNSKAPDRVPGGSSSGSASAVAGGACDTALGSDTGGSVRIPASFCGVFGMRPTHGAISLEAAMPLAPSFDTVGWFARDPSTFVRVGEVLLGGGAVDAGGPWRVRIVEDAFALSDPDVSSALMPMAQAAAERLGSAEPLTLLPGGFDPWLAIFRTLQTYEIWQTHAAWVTANRPQFGHGVRERFATAGDVTAADAAAANSARADFAAAVSAHLDARTVLCLPATPTPAPRKGTVGEAADDVRARTLRLTLIAGLARLPQIVMPAATVDGAPVGLSFIGASGADLSLLGLLRRLTA